ncbi:MAG: SAM-dependent chlorinase/fluorinase [Dehalococcoidales bacterium]|nr:SAM-dependent chlorinase/fluorinase [Dehalococcoidales bacterium]
MGAIITLTTDFGLTDAYVAAMKGVILSINPEANIVDICHTIKPQNIAEAAFVLSTACPFFPRGTIHVVVADPGVGTERRAIILKTPTACFVAPDNGVLSYVVQEYLVKPRVAASQHLAELRPGLEAVAITKPKYWRSPVGDTFHGRDIFAPVAARLSLGQPPLEFGEKITALTVLPIPKPHKGANGSLVGHILHIDSFGNLITNVNSHDLPEARETITVEVGGRLIKGLSRTYAESQGLLTLIGSSDYLEISLKEGNASAYLNAKVGDEVIITTHKGGKP